MPKLKLSFACGLYDRMQPLYTGEVRPDGIDLNFIAIDQPRPIFDRMSGGQEFDVAEYSLSEAVLSEFLKARLVNYKRPHIIEFRDGLPKSNIGKILRKELH